MRANLTRFTSPRNLTPRWFPSYLLCTLLLFPFHLLPSSVHPTRFSFWFFSGFLAIFSLLSSNNSNALPDFPSVSSLASLPYLPCCHRTTTQPMLPAVIINEHEVQQKESSEFSTAEEKGPATCWK